MPKLTSQTSVDFHNYLNTLDPIPRTVLSSFVREALRSMLLIGPMADVEPTVKTFRYLADIAEEALDYAKTESARSTEQTSSSGLNRVFDKFEQQLDPEEPALARVSAFMPLPGIFNELKEKLDAKLNQAQLDYLETVTNDTKADIKALREAVGAAQADLAVRLGGDIQMTFIPALMGGLTRESIVKVLETVLKQQRGNDAHTEMLKALQTSAPMPAQAA